MKRIFTKTRINMPRLISMIGGLKKYKIATTFLALMLIARTVEAQAPCSTCGVTDNGSNPPCPGGASALRIRATCDVAPLRVTIYSSTGTAVYTNTIGLTTLDAEQGVSPGTYRASLTCGSTERGDYTIQVQSPTPTATITRQGSPSSVGTVCNTPGLVLALNGTSYDNAAVSWSGAPDNDPSGSAGIIANPSASSSTLTQVPEGSYTYTYTVTKTGCDPLTATAALRVVNIPQMNPIGNIEVCSGDRVGPINFTAQNTANPPSFTWTNSRTSIGLESSGNGNSIGAFTASNTQAGVAEASVTVIAANNGCSTDPPIAFLIRVYPQIDAQLLKDKETYCAGENIVLRVTTNVGDAFTWTGPSGFSRETTGNTAASRQVTIQNATTQNTGNYSVIVKIGTGGCRRTITSSVNVIQGPDFRVTDQTICDNNWEGFAVNSPAVTHGSAPGLNYSYWFDEAATSSMPNTYRIPRTGGAFYIRTSGAGCVLTKRVAVTPAPAPVINVTNPAPVCKNSPSLPFNLSTAVQPGTPPPGVVYSYLQSDNSPLTLTANRPLVNEAGTNTYYVRGVATNGCSTTAEITVKINAAPNITMGSPPAICGSGNAVRVNLADPSLIGFGSESADAPTADTYPYTFWATDRGEGTPQNPGTPALTATVDAPGQGRAKLIPPLGGSPPGTLPTWEFLVPTDLAIPDGEVRKTHTYYVQAVKTYNDPAPANRCISVSRVDVIVARPPTVTLVTSAANFLCGTAKANLNNYISQTEGQGATTQFLASNQITPVSPERAGAGTYYVRRTTFDGCSTIAGPITIRQFDNPTLTVTNISFCYDPSNTTGYPLGGMVTAFNGTSLLKFSKTDAYNDDYTDQILPLPVPSASFTPSEFNTGISNQPIWVWGSRGNGAGFGSCSTRVSARITVKPLPRVRVPFGVHDLLCNNGKTKMSPQDENVLRYVPLPSASAAYTWRRERCDRDGNTDAPGAWHNDHGPRKRHSRPAVASSDSSDVKHCRSQLWLCKIYLYGRAE